MNFTSIVTCFPYDPRSELAQPRPLSPTSPISISPPRPFYTNYHDYRSSPLPSSTPVSHTIAIFTASTTSFHHHHLYIQPYSSFNRAINPPVPYFIHRSQPLFCQPWLVVRLKNSFSRSFFSDLPLQLFC